MASKPENNFIGRVNKHLPLKKVKSSLKARSLYPPERHLHYEKMNNPFRSGTADGWYSGRAGDLWVEYKYLERTPKRASVWPANPNEQLLSRLQVEWLNERYEEGRNVAVVVGCPDGGVVFTHREWDEEMVANHFVSLLRSEVQIAEWVFSQTA